MKFQAEGAKPYVIQPTVNDLQCRHLLRHKQDRLAFGQVVCNEVGNGLALTCAWWALKNQIAASINGADSFQLGRVGQQRSQDVLRLMSLIQSVEFTAIAFACKGLSRVLNQVLDYAVGLELLSAVLQVLPHEVLLKGEDSQMGLFEDFPLRNFANCKPKRLKDFCDVYSLVIGWNDVQARNAQFKAIPEQLQKSWIDNGLVVMSTEAEPRANRLTLQGYWNQQNGSKVFGLSLFGLSPFEQAYG